MFQNMLQARLLSQQNDARRSRGRYQYITVRYQSYVTKIKRELGKSDNIVLPFFFFLSFPNNVYRDTGFHSRGNKRFYGNCLSCKIPRSYDTIYTIHCSTHITNLNLDEISTLQRSDIEPQRIIRICIPYHIRDSLARTRDLLTAFHLSA